MKKDTLSKNKIFGDIGYLFLLKSKEHNFRLQIWPSSQFLEFDLTIELDKDILIL